MATRRKPDQKFVMISIVAERYSIHPQTLRLYEREGLLKPSRSEGNTRLYTQEDLEQLELILNLTRDLGVNLAGVEVILNMRQRLEEMHHEMQEFVEYVEREFTNRSPELNQRLHNALVKVTPPHVTLARPRKTERKENL